MIIDDLALVMANIAPRDLLILINRVGSAKDIISMSNHELRGLGLSYTVIERIKSQEIYRKAEQELLFIQKYNIRTLVFGTPEYPALLAECEDAPYMLFVKGDIDFNDSDKWISVVGTRKETPYGTAMTCSLIKEFAAGYRDGVVVSGLAYGIDTIAHRVALDNKIRTVAVLAHGFKTIYPPSNRDLAAKIIDGSGALVTEFTSEVTSLRHNFLQRNRIVAGLCGATLVIESPMKGGSIATATNADSYNREVFAVPGRATDLNSQGANNLIKNSKASILTSFSDVEAVMGWTSSKAERGELNLFAPPISGNELKVYNMLEGGELSLDEIIDRSGVSASVIAGVMSKLEIFGYVKSLRGRMYIKV